MGIGVPPVQILDPDTGLPLGTAANPITTSAAGGSVPDPADILTGDATVTATTLITIPAGRTWRGSLKIAANLTNGATDTGAKSSVTTIKTAGVGVVPAPGTTLLRIPLNLAANTASGVSATVTQGSVVMDDVVVVAPAGNAATLTFDVSAGDASGIAYGLLL